jgi:hypothetical protein
MGMGSVGRKKLSDMECAMCNGNGDKGNTAWWWMCSEGAQLKADALQQRNGVRWAGGSGETSHSQKWR